jgi:hypothetical protein
MPIRHRSHHPPLFLKRERYGCKGGQKTHGMLGDDLGQPAVSVIVALGGRVGVLSVIS